LKKIITALNRLSEVVQEKTGMKTYSVVIDEDPELIGVDPIISYTNNSFHEFVMAFKKNINSEELAKQLENISNTQFNELRDESVTLILPLLAKWLSDSEISRKGVAIVFLWEASRKFRNVFSIPSSKDSIKKCVAGLEKNFT